jgi:lysyl-tRNA synthetase class 2
MRHAGKPNLKFLRHRAELLRELRQFFDTRDFLEVQPPCLSADCVVDAYIDPIEISARQLQLSLPLSEKYYLQTSAEAAMKRLLAAGAPSIYSLGPVFRAGERGARHNVEFTMLEWYQVDQRIEAGIELLGELACAVLDARGYDIWNYRELFQESLGIDPIDSPLAELRALVAASAPSMWDADRDSLLDVLLTSQVEPTLGVERPAIVRNFPLSQAALARTAEDDPQCAARFELFVKGVELANGYDELTDVQELVARTQIQNAKRGAIGRAAIASESAFLHTITAGLPVCTGVAVGVDRLLMVRCGARTIDETLPFPIEIA